MADKEAEEAPVVARCVDQRQPQACEPMCVICARYGEYVCDATDEDVCSMQCRDICMARRYYPQGSKDVATKQQLSAVESPEVMATTAKATSDEVLRRRLGIKIREASAGAEASSSIATETARTGRGWPTPLVDFEHGDVELPTGLLENMRTNNFDRPTPIQMQAIPCILRGDNVLASAPTGTGKTAAYLVPVVATIIRSRDIPEEPDRSEEKPITALVLAPIRELAIQIEGVAKLLMRGIPDMKTALLVGGFPVPTQRYRLQNGVQLIVATPGRFLDIFTNYAGGGSILCSVRMCVIDEVDIMLDIGFRPQIAEIVSLLPSLSGPRGLQMLFFSATVSEDVESLVKQTLTTPSRETALLLRISVGGEDGRTAGKNAGGLSVNPVIQQSVQWTEDKAKKKALFAFLDGKSEESTLVFVDSKIGATMLAGAITKCCGILAAAIHADKSQEDRLAALEMFITREAPVLVSTNVLSRGMDLLHVQNVVVFDFPKKTADYIHLIGRTGRGNEGSGIALALVNLESRSLFPELAALWRHSKTAIPREIYQSLHTEAAKQRARSSEIVIDESKRAFRARKQLDDELGGSALEWKEWNSRSSKRQRLQHKACGKTG